MQTIFLATDKSSGEAWMYNKRPINCAGDFCAGDSIRCRKWFFQDDAPPPGECREYQLVPVGEADDRNARIAELEAKLAERSPGVMPECVAKLVAATKDASTSWRQFEEASIAVEAYYAQPFVFTGEPALYEVKMDSGAEIRCDVYQTRKGPVLDWYNGAIISLNSDGTFSGGRIVRRADQ